MTVAVDTSVAVPYLMASHEAHEVTSAHLAGRDPVLTQHSMIETYSVLTRLPGGARVAPGDAVELIRASFGDPVGLDAGRASSVPERLAAAGIVGGAVYDALVAMAAGAGGIPLVTRDARALPTYAALGVAVEVVAATPG